MNAFEQFLYFDVWKKKILQSSDWFITTDTKVGSFHRNIPAPFHSKRGSLIKFEVIWVVSSIMRSTVWIPLSDDNHWILFPGYRDNMKFSHVSHLYWGLLPKKFYPGINLELSPLPFLVNETWRNFENMWKIWGIMSIYLIWHLPYRLWDLEKFWAFPHIGSGTW